MKFQLVRQLVDHAQARGCCLFLLGFLRSDLLFSFVGVPEEAKELLACDFKSVEGRLVLFIVVYKLIAADRVVIVIFVICASPNFDIPQMTKSYSDRSSGVLEKSNFERT